MPSWNEIISEVNTSSDIGAILEKKRIAFFKCINKITGRNVIAYYSSWLQRIEYVPGLSIEDNDKNAFMTTVHKLDKSKGLDLILHTPGGDIAATESIVSYLKSIFGNDIRAFVPQISMSAGTMIAMSCKEIIMGNQSSLGPIDPQKGGIACQAVLEEYAKAIEEVKKEPASLGLWQVIISKYNPTFLIECENALKWSIDLASQWLSAVNNNINIDNVINIFINHSNSYSHNRHLSKQDCKDAGLNIIDLEDNQELQDAILSLHHCYMILFDKFKISKIVENHIGARYMKHFK